MRRSKSTVAGVMACDSKSKCSTSRTTAVISSGLVAKIESTRAKSSVRAAATALTSSSVVAVAAEKRFTGSGSCATVQPGIEEFAGNAL
jgi:hypothetical protein